MITASLKNRISLLALLLAIIGLTACVKTTATRSPQGSPAGSEGVQVLYSAPTDHEFTGVGLVTTQTGQTIFHDRSVEGMIKCQRQPGRLKGNSVIVQWKSTKPRDEPFRPTKAAVVPS